MEYTLKRYRRSKCIRISIRVAGVLVTAPKWVSRREIEKFVESRECWIQEQIASLPKTKTFSRLEKEKMRRVARIRVHEMLLRVNGLYRFSYRRVFIRDTTSRWGSCSESGNLNFSLRAALLPDDLLEYLVAHELSHLEEMNHSEKFWKLVEHAIPHYGVRRRSLRAWEKENT